MLHKKEKKQIYQSPEYKQFIILRIINYIFIAFIIISLGLSALFIQKNIFNTIEQAESILLLKNDPSTEIINFDKYETVEKKWQEKNSLISTPIERDPFNNINSTVPQVTES